MALEQVIEIRRKLQKIKKIAFIRRPIEGLSWTSIYFLSTILVFMILIAFSLLSSQAYPYLGKGIEEVSFLLEQPLLITSAGQSAEVQLASVLAKRVGLTYSLSKLATSKELTDIKTLVLVLGASMKGLGAAGLDEAKEKERVSSLIAEAKKKNIPLLCLHLGGEARRGQLTDEMIVEFLPFARMAIVVKSGNKDGIFTKICQEKSIPLIEVEKIVDAASPLQKIFKVGSSIASI